MAAIYENFHNIFNTSVFIYFVILAVLGAVNILLERLHPNDNNLKKRYCFTKKIDVVAMGIVCVLGAINVILGIIEKEYIITGIDFLIVFFLILNIKQNFKDIEGIKNFFPDSDG